MTDAICTMDKQWRTRRHRHPSLFRDGSRRNWDHSEDQENERVDNREGDDRATARGNC